MEIEYPLIEEPATPEFVLAVLQDMHRLLKNSDMCMDPNAVLDFDTTVREWQIAGDLVRGKELGRAHNRIWGIECSNDEWRAVLEPAQERQLRDVCELISKHATRRRIQPTNLVGEPCGPAGAFLTVRSLLASEGADVEGITPTALLAPYLRGHLGTFICSILRLAPGKLPPLEIVGSGEDNPGCRVLSFTIVSSALGLAMGIITDRPAITWSSLALFLASLLIAWLIHDGDVEYRFGNVRTFGDLAVAISQD